jgi:hypothetical protein
VFDLYLFDHINASEMSSSAQLEWTLLLSRTPFPGVAFLESNGTGVTEGRATRRSDQRFFSYFESANLRIAGGGGGGGTSGGLVDAEANIYIASLSFSTWASLRPLSPNSFVMEITGGGTSNFHEPELYSGSLSCAISIDPLHVNLSDNDGSGFRCQLLGEGGYDYVRAIVGANGAHYPTGSILPSGNYLVVDPVGGVSASDSRPSGSFDGSISATFTTPPPPSTFVGALRNTPASHGHVSVPDSPTLRPQRFTIEASIHPEGPSLGPAGSLAMIVGKGPQGWTGGPRGLHYAWLRINDGRFGFELIPGLGQAGVVVLANATAPVGVTTHMAATYDGQRLRLYTNGVLDAEAAVPFSSISYDASPVRIGALEHCCGLLGRLNGRIDAVRIWNHPRSAALIQADMECPPVAGAPGLLAHWDLNSSAGDSSGNANHGTIVGSPLFDVTLLERETLTIVEQPVPQVASACCGAELSTWASGAAPFYFEWQRRRPDGSWEPQENTPTIEPRITATTVYRCRVSNECGSVYTNEVEVRFCPGDYNCDMTIDSVDFFEYLGDFFFGARCADVNQDSFVNSADFFSYLASFFAGC